MKFRPSLPLLLGLSWSALCSSPAVHAASLSDADIAAVRAVSRQRCAAFFQQEAGKPFAPAAIKKDWNNRGDFTRHYNQSVVLFAFRAFQLQEQLPAANQALREMCQYHLDRPQTLLEIHSFPWTLGMLPHLIRLYGPEGTRTRGLISPATHDLILQTMWVWAREKSRLADAEFNQSHTWYITDSENHHANHFASCWAVSLILAQSPVYRDRKYQDGHSAREHAEAWTAYLREYLRERARKGMTIEIDSPSYSTATLTAVYRIYELTDDPVLKKRADAYITLFWALWAEHQIDGIGGGAKTRTYADSAKRGNDFMCHAAWYLLGIGDPEFVHASMLEFVLSSWEMPAVVIDLALDVRGRGTYETRQRRIGLAEPGFSKPHHYRIRTDTGGILRYGYCTPDFVMGSLLTDARPEEDWAAISAQNRWMGVIFRGTPDARIYPTTVNREGESIYNGHWAAQSGPTLIAQKLKTSRRVDEWRVWFSKSGLSAPARDGRWVFAEAPGAYAAVHVAQGEFTLPPSAVERFGRWLLCADDTSPIIVEVEPKSGGRTFDAFRRAILAQTVTLTGNILRYTSLKGARFTFFTDQSAPPKINDQPVNLAPAQVFYSPFVQSRWNSGVVTIQKGDRTITLDFNR